MNYKNHVDNRSLSSTPFFRICCLLLMVFLVAATHPLLAQRVMPPVPVPAEVLANTRSNDATKRREAAEELGALRSRDGVMPLLTLLQDKVVAVREAAAFALGQSTDRRALPALIKAAADRDSEVRAAVAFALGMIGGSKTEETVSKLLDDRSALVRASAVTAIGLLEDADGVDEIIALLNDPSFDVRFDAAWALGQMNDDDAINPLQVAMISIDALSVDAEAKEEFRLQAKLSIDRIRAQEGGYTPTRPRKATEGVIPLNVYENRTSPVGIRQSVKAVPTEQARTGHLAGTVRVKILVGADGRPARAYVLKRAGNGLDQRAVQAVLQYKFEPAMLSGLPQTSWFFLDVKF